jgi:TrmH family RNA methyltransferase
MDAPARSEGGDCRSTQFEALAEARTIFGDSPAPNDMLPQKTRKEISSLHRRRHRDRHDAFIVEGIRSVDAALSAGARVRFLLQTHDAATEARAVRARALGGETYEVSPQELEKVSDVETSQGVLLVAGRRLLKAEAILDAASVLVLDGIQNPGNVGALLRTAAWFGVEAVLAGPGTSDFFNAKAARASMGAIWDLKLAGTADLAAWLGLFRRRGGRAWAADLTGMPVGDWDPGSPPSAFVIGSEAHGLSDALRDRLNGLVHIPRSRSTGVTESLNAAVAGALLLSEWTRKLLSPNK